MADDLVTPEPTEPVEPGTPPAPAPVVAATPEPPAPPEPPPAPAPAPAPDAPREHGNKGKTPWYLTRISEAEHAKRLEAEGRAAEKRRADAAEEMLARMQRGETPAPGTVPAPVTRQPGQSQEDFQREVKAEAQRQRIYEDTISVRDAGLQKFADFGETLNVLTAIGLTRDDVVADLIAVDKTNAHVILDKLAKDQDKAAAIAAMSPQRRIAEFTRMSMAETAPPAPPAPATPPKAVPASKAPAPPPKLAPVSERPEGEDFSDDRSDDEWSAAWDRKHLKSA